jgi:hypothetical protein
MRYAHLAPDAGRDEVRLLDDGHLMANQKQAVGN